MMILSMISDEEIESCVVQEKEQPKKSPVPMPRLFVKKLGKFDIESKVQKACRCVLCCRCDGPKNK